MRFNADEVEEYLELECEEMRCLFALNKLCVSCKDDNYTSFIETNSDLLYGVLESLQISKQTYEHVKVKYFANISECVS